MACTNQLRSELLNPFQYRTKRKKYRVGIKKKIMSYAVCKTRVLSLCDHK